MLRSAHNYSELSFSVAGADQSIEFFEVNSAKHNVSIEAISNSKPTVYELCFNDGFKVFIQISKILVSVDPMTYRHLGVPFMYYRGKKYYLTGKRFSSVLRRYSAVEARKGTTQKVSDRSLFARSEVG